MSGCPHEGRDLVNFLQERVLKIKVDRKQQKPLDVFRGVEIRLRLNGGEFSYLHALWLFNDTQCYPMLLVWAMFQTWLILRFGSAHGAQLIDFERSIFNYQSLYSYQFVIPSRETTLFL